MATSRAVLACALAASPALGSYPLLKQYQPHDDVKAEARIDLDVEEILAKLPSDGAADFTGAMAIYSGGGDSKAIIAATLESLATPGATTMASDTWYPVYKAYWGSQINYADTFVQDAASGTLPDAMKKELIKKGIVYQGVWMYAVHNLEKGKRECDVDFWDEGMAYYIGSLEGEYATSADYASTGNLLYALAQKRCAEFGTCATTTDSSTIAAVNTNVQSVTGFGKQGYDLIYMQKACNDANLDLAFKGMVSQMTVPLVQGMLKYAWKADPAKSDSCDGQAGNDAATVATNDAANSKDCAKSWAEGWAFAAAVLPQVHKCDATAATTIRANLDVASTEPMKDGVAAVKAAIEGVYDCLGITCTDVGEYQASGMVKSGMDACTFAPANDVDSTTSSGATVPMDTDSAAHRAGAALAGAVVAAAVIA
jgi:hypothetical protein